jgi:RimJ/RimL family protein N-acetyltransferase
MHHLLDEARPADAMAAYYAFYHPDEKTQLVTYPAGAPRATGYVALSRTGMDLFRPLVTLRLPITDLTTSADVIYQALQPGAAVILSSPARYTALLQALFDSQTEELLRLYVLDPNRFQPIINVLVTQSTSPNNWPRFIIRRSEPGNGEVVAAAGLNWLSPRYAEISVHTAAHYQRQGWGRSVVAAMAEHLLKNGRTPLYVVSEKNEVSIRLAESVGFVDSGVRETLIQGTLKPRP